jgi:hypothetical protein
MRALVTVAAFFFLQPGLASAQYTLILKNGRRITVQSFREEAGMVKFRALGGEVGIARDQVREIVKGGQASPGFVVPPGGEPRPAPPPAARETAEEPGAREPAREERRAREEAEYRKRVQEVTEKLKQAQERYLGATRGKGGGEPMVLETEEQIRARSEDLVSRLRDVQHHPAGPPDAGGARLLVPSPFSGVPAAVELAPGAPEPRVDSPAPSYSPRQRELSELRAEIARLERERERLIAEMKQKKLDAADLFLDSR